jgi:MtrB/PioB family decaheme-associated outer membrane protein
MSKNIVNKFNLLPVTAAILLAYGNAYAAVSPEVHDLITPESSISVGLGVANSGNDAKRFSEYTGINRSAVLLLDLEMIKRDDSGYWSRIIGRNLGLETREFSISQQQQGNWGVAIDYNEIVRLDPYIIHTGMTGIGTTNPTVNLIALPAMPAAWITANGLSGSSVQGSDTDLKLKRTALGISGDKWFTPELQVELSFKNEEKKGARMFGRVGIDSSDMQLRPANASGSNAGNGGVNNANGGWAILLTPEPINSSTRQMEAKLNYNHDKLAVTGGYYGSFFVNNNGSLTPNVPGTLDRGALWTGCNLTAPSGAGCSTIAQLAASAVALPQDNQAHQLYLSGNYAFSDTTRSTFKLSYTHATQNEGFVATGLTPAATAPANLGGVVDTKLAQLGLTMRPLKELSINASLRYEDRADNTPINVYNTSGTPGTALNNTTNFPSGSQTRTTAKVDGIYRLPSGISATLGVDWERKETPLPPPNTALFNGQVIFRSALNENGVHAELRKALSDKVNGALALEFKQRRGGTWWTASGNTTITALNPIPNAMIAYDPAGALGNKVLPDLYMDRDRSKLRANLDWEASDKVSVQAVVDHTQDDYKRDFNLALAAPTEVIPTIPGARTIISDSLSLDSTYVVSEDWKVNGYLSHTYNRWNVNKASLGDDTRNTTDTFGLGVKGKANARLTFGVDLLATRDKTTFNNLVATPVAGAAPGNNLGWVGQSLPGNFLPEINYTTEKLNLNAKYAIDKKSDVQAVLSYQHFKTDDWQWGYNGIPFLYSDNTTVSQPMDQHLVYVAARYLVKF